MEGSDSSTTAGVQREQLGRLSAQPVVRTCSVDQSAPAEASAQHHRLTHVPLIGATALRRALLEVVEISKKPEASAHRVHPVRDVHWRRQVADFLRLELGLAARPHDVLRIERPRTESIVDHVAPDLEHRQASDHGLIEGPVRKPRQVVEIARQAGAPEARQLLGDDLLDARYRDGRYREVIALVDRQRDRLGRLGRQP
jgi:hypothetical protein